MELQEKTVAGDEHERFSVVSGSESFSAASQPSQSEDPERKPMSALDLIPDVEFVRFRRSDALEEFMKTRPTEGGMTLIRWRCACFIENTYARAAVISAIIINAIIVGIYANNEMSSTAYDFIDLLFTIFFT